MQIWVLCPEGLSPTKPPTVELKKTWFSWEGVKIRHAITFSVVVGIMYLTEYFVPVKPPTHHSKQKGEGINLRSLTSLFVCLFVCLFFIFFFFFEKQVSYKLCMHSMVKDRHCNGFQSSKQW